MKTVIEMAHETLDRMPPDDHCNKPYWTATDEELERLVELVIENFLNRTGQYVTNDISREAVIFVAIADEREACAKVCDAINAVYNKPKDSAERVASQWCAERIRARGNT